MADGMSEWGIYDWMDAGAYPDPDSTTMREWWWEFLRRRPCYRDHWSKARHNHGENYRYAADVDAFRLRYELSVIHDPRIKLTDHELLHFREPRNYGTTPRQTVLEQRGLEGFDEFAELIEHKGRLSEAANQYLYSFDLNRPIAPQIRKAESLLKSVQQSLLGPVPTRRPRIFNWPLFLRALDARECGATFEQMRDAFWPNRAHSHNGNEGKSPQSARDTYNAACELRDNFPI